MVPNDFKMQFIFISSSVVLNSKELKKKKF